MLTTCPGLHSIAERPGFELDLLIASPAASVLTTRPPSHTYMHDKEKIKKLFDCFKCCSDVKRGLGPRPKLRPTPIPKFCFKVKTNSKDNNYKTINHTNLHRTIILLQMARYGLFVLKVASNPNQANNQPTYRPTTAKQQTGSCSTSFKAMRDKMSK